MDKMRYQVFDVYLAAYMASHNFALDLELITPTKVAFVFTGTQEQIDQGRNAFFHDHDLQAFVGSVRQLKIALHDRLRKPDIDIHQD